MAAAVAVNPSITSIADSVPSRNRRCSGCGSPASPDTRRGWPPQCEYVFTSGSCRDPGPELGPEPGPGFASTGGARLFRRFQRPSRSSSTLDSNGMTVRARRSGSLSRVPREARQRAPLAASWQSTPSAIPFSASVSPCKESFRESSTTRRRWDADMARREVAASTAAGCFGGRCRALSIPAKSSMLFPAKTNTTFPAQSDVEGVLGMENRWGGRKNPIRSSNPRSSLIRNANSKRTTLHSPRATGEGTRNVRGEEEVVEAEDASRGEENRRVDGARNERESSGDGEQKRGAQSSWDAKNALGEDYLYRLGKESDNLNITVGARSGVVDDLFVGGFLGKDADIVFKYRQQVTRKFEHIQGDYYIAPEFMEKVVVHIAKNYLTEQLDAKVPLILGIWGGKGQGKTFQTELIFKAMGVEPVIMSAGELESEWAGEPGRLIRDRYRAAAAVIKNKGVMSCLMINDLDAGVGRFENTQVTVNNQIVMGTLMNLCDNPHSVSVGQSWREDDIVARVPIIVTGNDLSTLYAPLIRDGRMEKFYWAPTREDLIEIVHQMYKNDNLSKDDIRKIVDLFPGQALDFYGALRSRTYDDQIRKWVDEVGGPEQIVKNLMKIEGPRPTVTVPEISLEGLIQAGNELVAEQRKVTEMRLSDEYMKKQTGSGGGLSFSS